LCHHDISYSNQFNTLSYQH
jgi:hypothetical protein